MKLTIKEIEKAAKKANNSTNTSPFYKQIPKIKAFLFVNYYVGIGGEGDLFFIKNLNKRSWYNFRLKTWGNSRIFDLNDLYAPLMDCFKVIEDEL